MPITYSCSSCRTSFSLGSYHGFGSQGWFNGVYCRHCGTAYTLEQSHAQFFDSFSREPSVEPQTLEYKFIGRLQTQSFVLAKDSPPPIVTCEVCKTIGPFGPGGPITDEVPEGLTLDWDFPSEVSASKRIGKCPKCKKQTMRATGEWIT